MPSLAEPISFKDKSMLTTHLAACRRALMPMSGVAERDRIAVALSRMFQGFPNTSGLTPETTIAAYVGKLADLPAWAIEQAIHDIERGRVGGMSPDFPPSASRIYQLAETLLAETRAEKSRIDTLLKARVDQEKPRHPDEIARVAAKMRDFAEKMTGNTPQEDEQRKAARHLADAKKAKGEENSRRMEYLIQGFEPPTNKHGMTMSLSLARAMELPLTKRKAAPAPDGGPL